MNEEYRARLCAILHLPDDDGWEPIVRYVDLIVTTHAKLKYENIELRRQLDVLEKVRRLVGALPQ